jgi:hypothetical protein
MGGTMENERADANRAAYSQFLTRLDRAMHEPLDAERTVPRVHKPPSSLRRLLYLISPFLISGAVYLGWRMIL